MVGVARHAYAVCPPIEVERASDIPKLFKTEVSAKRFLHIEIPRGR